MTRIVVGTDGSPSARAALDWAYDEAERWGAELDVIHVWSFPNAYGAEGALAISPEMLTEDATRLVQSEIDLLRDRKGDKVTINRVVEGGGVSICIVERAKDAALVVVGARGHGGFLSLLLGSVADQVVHHATCPVVVVHDRKAA